MTDKLTIDNYNEYLQAKQLLTKYGYIIIQQERYNSIQKRILDLEKENAIFAKVYEKGLSLMSSINLAINFDNGIEWMKGTSKLPESVIEEMTKFTKLLHDSYDERLPLINDEKE